MRNRSLGVALVVLMVLTAGCSKSKTTTESVATTRAPGSVSTTTAGGSATTASDGSSSNGSSGTVSGVPNAKCINFAMAWAQIYSKVGSAGSGANSNALKDELKNMQGAVPSEIKDDFNTIAAAYTTYLQALSDAGNDPTKLAAAAEKLNNPDLQTASDNINKWTDANCKGQ